jgi:uncharacterized protein (DUF2147 family)
MLGVCLKNSVCESVCFLALAFGYLAALPLAADAGPAGVWKTVDDKTGKPRGTVLIYEQNGAFFGKIASTFNPKEADERCTLCKDKRKDGPVIGLLILRNMKENSGGEYDGGDILDPDTGAVYRCKMRLAEGGKKLVVRGYIGFALLGRSQVWSREP